MNQPFPGRFNIPFRSLLCLLLKSVQDIHSLGQPHRINDSVSARTIPNSYFFNTVPYGRDRLKVVWRLTFLQSSQLIPAFFADPVGKLAQNLQRIAEKADWLHSKNISERVYSTR